MLFHEMSHFLQRLAEKLPETEDHDNFGQKLPDLAQSMIFQAFSRNEPLFATLGGKVAQNARP